MKRVELYTCQRVKEGRGKDLLKFHDLTNVSVEFQLGYKRLSAMARRISKSIGCDSVKIGGGNVYYQETEDLQRGLAAVQIIIYNFGGDKTDTVFEHDFFENGEYAYTIEETFKRGTGEKSERRYVKTQVK